MIYLSFNVSQKFFPLRIGEMHKWEELGKKYKIPVYAVTPNILHTQTTNPLGVYNMLGPVNTSHYRFLKTLEMQGVRYINDIENSTKADDKFISALECRSQGIRTPKNIDFNILAGVSVNLKGELAEKIKEDLGFPCVLKYPNAGFGQGHFLIKNENEFNDIYSMISLTNPKFGVNESGIDYFLQEYIPPPKGFQSHTIRVHVWKENIINGYIKHSPINWKSNIEFGLNVTNFCTHFTDIDRKIDKELEFLTSKITKLFKLKFASIDFYETKDGYVLGEINSCPGIFFGGPDYTPFGTSGFNPFDEIIKELTK